MKGVGFGARGDEQSLCRGGWSQRELCEERLRQSGGSSLGEVER